MKRVAIIGSFQRYYENVVEVMELFNSNSLYVTSPKKSKIYDRIDDFVIFESDNKNYSPEEIQMITLEKILRADVIYVYNKEGYVGKTTSYEIGVCYSKQKPVYFLCMPQDLPIPINSEQIQSPANFVKLILGNKQKLYSEHGFCCEASLSFQKIFGEEYVNDKNIKGKNIVICGSMHFYDDMVLCKTVLEKKGIHAIIPKDEKNVINYFSTEEFMQFKRKVSSAYLKKIRNKSTSAILVYNATKNGRENYIGANTLVELAMAFIWNRKIFILNDIYEPLKDELIAWNCIFLKGDLEKLVYELNREKVHIYLEDKMEQVSLFESIDGESNDC